MLMGADCFLNFFVLFNNTRRFLQAHNKETPQFCRQVAEKTLLVGLCSTVFREAKYTSHEVIIDDSRIRTLHPQIDHVPIVTHRTPPDVGI